MQNNFRLTNLFFNDIIILENGGILMMKNKIFILLAAVLALVMICFCSCGGDDTADTTSSSGDETTQATTVDMALFSDPDTPKRTIMFGGEEKEIFLSNQITISGVSHDLFLDRELNVYDILTGTNTFYLVSFDSFSAAQSDTGAGMLASSFLSPQIKNFTKYQWAASSEDGVYNVEFTISDDAGLAFLSDPEYTKIVAVIPKTADGPAEFWFTK